MYKYKEIYYLFNTIKYKELMERLVFIKMKSVFLLRIRGEMQKLVGERMGEVGKGISNRSNFLCC